MMATFALYPRLHIYKGNGESAVLLLIFLEFEPIWKIAKVITIKTAQSPGLQHLCDRDHTKHLKNVTNKY